MSPRRPDAAWQSIVKSLGTALPPQDKFLQKVYEAYRGTAPNTTYAYACELASNPQDRETVVAFFLCGATIDEISTSLKIDKDVIEVFGDLVIDLSVFRNKLELLRYAHEYRKTASEYGNRLVELGLVQGPLALMHHFLHGHEELSIDPKVYARKMMQQAFYFGMMARGNSIKSGVSKEALRWISTTASLLKDYDRLLGDTHDSDEALLEIEKRQMTNTPEELGIEIDQILH